MRETKADMLQGLFGVASAKIIRPNTLRIKFDDGTEAVRSPSNKHPYVSPGRLDRLQFGRVENVHNERTHE